MLCCTPTALLLPFAIIFCSTCIVTGVPMQASASDEQSIDGERQWQRELRVPSDELVQFRVGLKHPPDGMRALEAVVLSVSDPSSVEYGRHLSLRAVQQLVMPSQPTLTAVRQWLGDAGVDLKQVSESSNGDFMSCLIPARVAEALLGVGLYRFRSENGGSMSIVRTAQPPKIPPHIGSLTDFVSPANRFPAVRVGRAQTAPVTDAITPKVLRKMYNISAVGGKSKTSQAVASFLDEYFSPADLLAFQSQFSPESRGRTPKVVGRNVPTSPTLEASLDTQYLMAVAPAVASEFWYTAGGQPHNPGAEPFVEFLAALADTDDAAVPKVFSISYADDENQVDVAYARRVSVELQKAAARGITLVVASGDCGVGGNTNQRCHGKPFVPTFPASSPFITAVGGTWGQPETAFEISGGGFSNYFARPAYQHKAVHAFLKSAKGSLPPKHRYNATGRGFPDVAAQSANFAIKVAGHDDSGYGTSAAAPVVAAVVSLLNDERVAAGKSTLGFLNPLIYSALDAGLSLFHDITAGHNPGCGSSGFSAQAGWDPVAGAGTPDFGRLLDYVLSLP